MSVKFIRNINILRVVAKGLDKDIKQIAAEAETDIKNNTPVLTGILKASIKAHKLSFLKSEVASNIVYARRIEYGDVGRSPRAMYRKGAAIIQRKGKRLLKNSIL